MATLRFLLGIKQTTLSLAAVETVGGRACRVISIIHSWRVCVLSFGGGDQLTDFERAGAINALKDIECGGKLRLCRVVRVLAADQAWRAAPA